MSPRSRFEWYPTAPKKPPPEHGIRMKQAGTTWWGQRWINALEVVLRGDAGRLARGRTYARAGRTHDLVIERGKVTAKVTGSRSTPYKVTVELAQLGEAAWRKAIAGMAEKAQFSAELLAGQMPTEIDQVFEAAGVSLFPRERADLNTSCSCPDWGDPCKHVAATHYVLGQALDGDPFLLFELRGKSKEAVLDALRAARGTPEPAPLAPNKKRKPDALAARDPVPTVSLGKLKVSDYDRLREPLPSLEFNFDEPVMHAAVLRQLGAPPAWQSDMTPADVLAPLVHAAADAARRIAMAEAPQPAAVPLVKENKAAPKKRSPKRAKPDAIARRAISRH